MDLSDFFTTKSQATDFSARLATLSEMIYKTNFQLESALMELFGIQKKEKFLSFLRENNVAIDNPSSLKDFFLKLQTTIAQLPVFSLTIAFEPSEATLQAISSWFLLNLKKQMLFEFTVDSSLIGGAVINYNGKFKDYSVKKPVEQLVIKLMQPQQPVAQHPATQINSQQTHT